MYSMDKYWFKCINKKEDYVEKYIFITYICIIDSIWLKDLFSI